MNCVLLLLLLSCCSWGNGCSCNSNRCGCRTEQRGCRREARVEMPRRECCSGMDSGRNDSCARNMDRQAECCECDERRGCGCEEERSGRGGCGCEEERGGRGGCGCEEDHHDHGDCGCMERESDGPGMIPPPWQDYPKFPRRDRGEECDG